MTPRQLKASLEKLHPDFLDTDIVIVTSTPENSEKSSNYSLLAGSGFLIMPDKNSVFGLMDSGIIEKFIKEKRIKFAESGNPVTSSDLNLNNNETEEL